MQGQSEIVPAFYWDGVGNLMNVVEICLNNIQLLYNLNMHGYMFYKDYLRHHSKVKNNALLIRVFDFLL